MNSLFRIRILIPIATVLLLWTGTVNCELETFMELSSDVPSISPSDTPSSKYETMSDVPSNIPSGSPIGIMSSDYPSYVRKNDIDYVGSDVPSSISQSSDLPTGINVEAGRFLGSSLTSASTIDRSDETSLFGKMKAYSRLRG